MAPWGKAAVPLKWIKPQLTRLVEEAPAERQISQHRTARKWMAEQRRDDGKEHRRKSDKLLLLALLLFNLLALGGVGAAIVWAFRTVF